MIKDCPVHGLKVKIARGWRVPVGYDPKMVRCCCLECIEAWYYAPRFKRLVRWSEVVQMKLEGAILT